MYKMPCTNCDETVEPEFWEYGDDGPIFRARCSLTGGYFTYVLRSPGYSGWTKAAADAGDERRRSEGVRSGTRAPRALSGTTYRIQCSSCRETVEVGFWTNGNEGPIFRGSCSSTSGWKHYLMRSSDYHGHTELAARIAI